MANAPWLGDQIPKRVLLHAWKLSCEATKALSRMTKRPTIISACYQQGELLALVPP